MPDGTRRVFTQRSRAWYSKHLRESEDEFNINLAADGGGTKCEFSIRWHGGASAWRLEVFSDAWLNFFLHFKDVPPLLAAMPKPDAETIRAGLKALGIEDVTPLVNENGVGVARVEVQIPSMSHDDAAALVRKAITSARPDAVVVDSDRGERSRG